MFDDRNLCLLFHGIREDHEPTPVRPELFVTRGELAALLDRLSSAGYRFTWPWDAPADRSRACAITFDDGYYNNQRFLPLAETYRAPALLFVVSYNVERRQPFIWDVWDAAGRGRWPLTQADYGQLYAEIEQGSSDLAAAARTLAATDLYRPFTREELIKFAESPWVRLAPHGHTHQPLVGAFRDRFREEVKASRAFVADLGNAAVDEFSFPCGLYDRSTRAQATSTFRRVYTINGGEMKAGDAVVSRISLINPAIGGPLIEQIRGWLGPVARLRRRLTNLRYSHRVLTRL